MRSPVSISLTKGCQCAFQTVVFLSCKCRHSESVFKLFSPFRLSVSHLNLHAIQQPNMKRETMKHRSTFLSENANEMNETKTSLISIMYFITSNMSLSCCCGFSNDGNSFKCRIMFYYLCETTRISDDSQPNAVKSVICFNHGTLTKMSTEKQQHRRRNST